MKTEYKEVIIEYPEFPGDNPRIWRNPEKPAIDARLVKELEDICRRPDGRPRYRVRYAGECYLRIENSPDVNENGLLVGVDRGGFYHEYALAIFDVEIGGRYKLKNGQIVYYPNERRHEAPFDAMLIETVYETTSIGEPRYIVEEFLDREDHPQFGDGCYMKIWSVDERVQIEETDTKIRVLSKRREFSRCDIELAKALYNKRRNLTRQDVLDGIRREREQREKAKAQAAAQEKAETDSMLAKYIIDKEYLEKTPRSYSIPTYLDLKKKFNSPKIQ